MDGEYKLSDKYIDFLKHEAHAELLEGTTAAGKTTVGILKFMLKVADSNRRQHVIAAKTTGVAEKNIINKEYEVTYYLYLHYLYIVLDLRRYQLYQTLY